MVPKGEVCCDGTVSMRNCLVGNHYARFDPLAIEKNIDSLCEKYRYRYHRLALSTYYCYHRNLVFHSTFWYLRGTISHNPFRRMHDDTKNVK